MQVSVSIGIVRRSVSVSPQLETEKSGFKTEVADQVVELVAQVATIDVTLQAGSQTQTVEVTTAAPFLTPSTAEVGSGKRAHPQSCARSGRIELEKCYAAA